MSASTTQATASQKGDSQQLSVDQKNSSVLLEPSSCLYEKRRKSIPQTGPKKVAFSGVEDSVNKKQTDFKRQDTPINYDVETCPDFVAA